MGLPKTELHVHLEGTLDPEMVVEFARKHQMEEFASASESSIRQRMGDARDLPSFIKVYEQMLTVLRTQDDFRDAAWRYLCRVHAQGVVYVELFFDPQMHTTRGIAFSTVMEGLRQAQREAADALGLRCVFIMCFNRDKSIESAFNHLTQALEYRDLIKGIGTDNPEHAGFARDFAPVYEKAVQAGFRLTSHCDAGFHASIQNIRECFELLRVERIDHGVNVLDDPQLISHALENKIGFTVCPTMLYTPIPGEINTGYFQRCASAAKDMLDVGLRVTLASDDPGVMCSQYVGDVYVNVSEELDLSTRDMITFAQNGFEMAWLGEEDKHKYLEKIDSYVKQHGALINK
jgi:adenine deaminase